MPAAPECMLARGAASAARGARGAFIVLEGVDRCGKTTQCKRLVESLKAKGLDAEMLRFPDRTTAVGTLIDAYLKTTSHLDDGVAHLLFSANRWEARGELLAKLNAGTTLVVDRYAYSGVAFTAAKQVPGLDAAWAAAPDSGLPAPDAVLLLALPPAVAATRGGFGGERYENEALLGRVGDEYRALMAADAARGARAPTRWALVDADGTPDEVAARVEAAAAPALEAAAAGAPLRALWEGGELAGGV